MLTQEGRKSHPSTSTSFTSVEGTKSYICLYVLFIHLLVTNNKHYFSLSKLLVQQRILDEAKAYPSKYKKKRWGK